MLAMRNIFTPKRCIGAVCAMVLAQTSFALETSVPLANSVQKMLEDKYTAGAPSKAIAVTHDGNNAYYVFSRANKSIAASDASFVCLQRSRRACIVYQVDDYPLYEDYAKAAVASAKDIANLPNKLNGKEYANEAKDEGVPPVEGLRGEEQISSTTPITAPEGAKAIQTADLVKLYKSNPQLFVIDAMPGRAGTRETLPNARWLSGSGNGRNPTENAAIDANIAIVMAEFVPQKDKSIVIYCAGWQCWHSWNAAKRLVALGYTNVYWYRGGIQAWKEAKLPTIKDNPIAAKLY